MRLPFRMFCRWIILFTAILVSMVCHRLPLKGNDLIPLTLIFFREFYSKPAKFVSSHIPTVYLLFWVLNPCDITLASSWTRLRLKSPAPRLFTQPFIQAHITETPKLRVTGLCAGSSAVNGEFLTQRASDAENVSSWWRHHGDRRVWKSGQLFGTHKM